MEKVVIKGTKRTVTGKHIKALRRDGKLPAVIYGRHTDPINITLESHSANLALNKVGSSTIVTIEVDGKEYPALVRERQRNYIKGVFTHIDFLTVSLSEKLRAEVHIELIGTSLAVKDFNAVLVTGLHTLSVECLPGDLPDRIVVDISPLVKVGDGIHVRDITLGDKVRILNESDNMIVNATYAKIEVEAPVAPVEGVVPEGEGGEPELSVERGKKEEEGAEDGKKPEKSEKAEKSDKTEKPEKGDRKK